MKKIELEDDKQGVDIKLSKSKNLLVIIGAFAFVLIGCSFINNPQGWASPVFRSAAVIYVAGICCVCVFGIFLLYALYKFIDTKVGLRLDSDGLYDNSSAANLKHIR